MEQYLEHLKERIVHAFNWEASDSGNTTQTIRIQLCNGDWIDGGLVRASDATFTVQVHMGPLGQNYRRVEIPYLSVAAIERYYDRE